MNISDNIKNLLFEHDCVIIPGFGGFVANYKPAQIDYDRNIFAPPSKDIGFNVQLIHNDGLLVSEVSRISGLGYPVARKNVENFARELKRKLEKGKKIGMDDLGTFFLDKEKNIQFEPDRSINFLKDSFGLSTFEFEQLEEFDVRKKMEKKLEARKVLQKPVRRKALRTTLIAVPLLVALVLIPIKTGWIHVNVDNFSLNPFHKTEINQPVSKLVTKIQPKTIAVVPSKQEGEKKETNYTEKSPEIISDLKTEKPQITSQPVMQTASSDISSEAGIKYFVIAGSFKSRNNADHLQNLLQGEGYSSKVMNAGNGFFRVGLQGSTGFSEAHDVLIAFREKHPGENYWILKK